jgi:uncharacterized protein YbbC (DUF1343 family)
MVITGLENLLGDPKRLNSLKGLRVGLVCHGASVDHRLRYSFDLLVASGVNLQFILVPEHGLFGEIPYMEKVDDCRLGHLGVPVISLYKDSADELRPPPGLLDSIDVLLCDIQDVGSRYYTYIATMAMLMEALSGTAARMIVLDRPNPVGCTSVEGNVPDAAVKSFVSYMPLLNRHGMTAGEAALYYRKHAGLDIDLDVVPCIGLTRNMMWGDTGLPFVPPSPNIPDAATALVYTGMCLLEGTNVSEGRGTASPFFFAGAPWVSDPWQLVAQLDACNLEGVSFRPVRFTPAFDKWAGHSCGGVHIVVSDQLRFKSLLTGMTLFSVMARMWPDQFALRRDAYEFVTDIPAIDLLFGNRWTADALLGGRDVIEIYDSFMPCREAFRAAISDTLLYR